MKKLISILAISLVFPLVAHASFLGLVTNREFQEQIEIIQYQLDDIAKQLRFLQAGGDGAALMLGADTTLPIAGTVYRLSGSGVSGSAASISLTSLTIPQTGYEIQDSDLSSTFYVTLEPGSRTRQELASCTTVTQNADDTATLTGCTRGLLPFSPYTASSTYQFAHGGGTSVVFSNPPQLYGEFAGKTNDETITGIWTFGTSSIPRLSGTFAYGAGDEDKLVTYRQLASTTFAGTVDATVSQKGIVELGTQAELASSSRTAGTSASLVVPIDYFNATSSATSTVPVTKPNGKLSQTFTDFSENFTYTGNINARTATSTDTSADAFNLIPAGVVLPYATTTPPSGYLACDGTSYATSSYPRLFNVIGYNYGGSAANFNVPDARGRFIITASSTHSAYDLVGDKAGEATTTLVVANLPDHSHAAGVASFTNPGGAGTDALITGINGSAGVTGKLRDAAGSTTASSTPFTNLPPYITFGCIIKY